VEEPIHCHYRWTLEEFVTAHQEYRRHTPQVRRILLILYAIALMLIAVAIVRLANLGFNRVSVVLFMFGISILAWRLLSGRALARMFAKLPDRDTDVHWQIYPDRLVIETPSSKVETAWAGVARVMRTEQGFLIYPQPGLFYWLPFHSFSETSDIERFEDTIDSKLTRLRA
jgi:hypothetical protein